MGIFGWDALHSEIVHALFNSLPCLGSTEIGSSSSAIVLLTGVVLVGCYSLGRKGDAFALLALLRRGSSEQGVVATIAQNQS